MPVPASATHTDPDGVDPTLAREPRSSPHMAGWQKLVGVIGLGVLLWVGDRYFDVVRFDGTLSGGTNMEHAPGDQNMGGEGPGGQSPAEPPDRPAQPTQKDPAMDPANGEQEHDPSQFDHG